jgi:HSP20 family molecular chaperone IbpA
VVIDGEARRSCLTPLSQVVGADVLTVEGLALSSFSTINISSTSFKLPRQSHSINMPFFQPAYLSPEATFFQLLSELDQPTHKASCRPHRRAETFTPRFDITETPTSYELYGEVPGLSQDDLTIEFSDAQTILIKGKTQRELSSATAQPEQSTTSDKGKERESDASSEKSHTPTVEDDYDDVDAPVASPTETATVTQEKEQEQPQTTETAAPKPKFWVAERKVGDFARSFAISQRVEQDIVSADLKNGILHIVVPKSQKPRKVTVTVN